MKRSYVPIPRFILQPSSVILYFGECRLRVHGKAKAEGFDSRLA